MLEPAKKPLVPQHPIQHTSSSPPSNNAPAPAAAPAHAPLRTANGFPQVNNTLVRPPVQNGSNGYNGSMNRSPAMPVRAAAGGAVAPQPQLPPRVTMPPAPYVAAPVQAPVQPQEQGGGIYITSITVNSTFIFYSIIFICYLFPYHEDYLYLLQNIWILNWKVLFWTATCQRSDGDVRSIGQKNPL